MTSFLSRLSPVPGFPAYTGPYKVGTIDVELPVSELESPSPCPDETIGTIQYRIFYPCEPESKGKTVNWVPAPQRQTLAAYGRFLGAGNKLAEFISFFPRIFHYIQIPAIKNAPLLSPATTNNRWPVMIFSHGLGGSRNAYSHLAGSIASHGMIVIAPEHRDGSTVISFIRSVPSPTPTSTEEKITTSKQKRTTDYVRLEHVFKPEVEEGRNKQLKIRLWELGLVHSSLLALDKETPLTNLNTSSTSLSPFASKMDIHEPGKIAFSGHSFGAATITQLIKSTFYQPDSTTPSSYKPIFTPSSNSPISLQITPQTPVILLDVWNLPLSGNSVSWLWNKPFPCYTPTGPGGSALLAIESEAFFKWRVHLKITKRLLSRDPSSLAPLPAEPEREQPHFYYAHTSAHLSQSDFGMLFPWVTKRFLAIEEPERIMRLNVRAITQLLRDRGIEVSETSHEDMEYEDPNAEATKKDDKIFRRGAVRGWEWISTDISEMMDINEQESMRSGAIADVNGDKGAMKEARETVGGIEVS
ncbi:hypothetical protein HYFRA_00012787 [Hymenoscyphus fraxineus]|uniref:Putative phospholipase n=1 Tax=Hymenoscyphus fraxineus TaxID=746836 RepID=A0A9N9LB56_9HELO|nr:hypothetical protein HYFRA_00012787 [Hymenoscyphus fraxineus]